MTDATLYQYCQKLVLLRNNDTEVLLARRQDEEDYNGTYALTGGKLETSDGSILKGIKREKDEEIGHDIKLRINPTMSYNLYFVKKNGKHIILPHLYAEYISGEVNLSTEYSDYKWVKINELDKFEPKIENISDAVTNVLKLKKSFTDSDYVII